MSSAAPLRRWYTRRSMWFAAALLLPAISAFLTTHIHVLSHVSFTLFFLATVLIATLGGLSPSLTAAAVVVAITYLVPLGTRPAGLYAQDIPRDLLLFLAAILISLISDSRRRYASELRFALSELHERSDDLVASLNSSRCACWTLDLDSGHSARWYSESYPVFGRPFRELEAMSSLDSLLHPEDQPRLALLILEMRSSPGPILFEHRALWPNGETHWLEMRGNRVAGPGCRWRGVTVDITERKLSEAALLRSEKLAAMGRLASTVAHEINNPLEALTNLLYLARTSGNNDPETDDYLASADRELARLSNITRLTLGFVRTSGIVADTDVAEVVDDVLSLLNHRLETRNVHVERDYQPGISIHIAPHELRQIVTNLIANAADAVATENGHIAVRISGQDGIGTLLIEDNGGGIPESLLPRIFEPFFTTKHEVGTGIGLWVTRELVERNKGYIDVQSQPPANTRPSTVFRVDFPLSQSAAEDRTQDSEVYPVHHPAPEPAASI